MNPEEPTKRQKEICDKFISKIKEEILDHLGVILERVYWNGVEDGYHYKVEENKIKEDNNVNT